jgi:hypothetical protein
VGIQQSFNALLRSSSFVIFVIFLVFYLIFIFLVFYLIVIFLVFYLITGTTAIGDTLSAPLSVKPSTCQAVSLYTICWTLKKRPKLCGLSPQANYTDRATAACRRS